MSMTEKQIEEYDRKEREVGVSVCYFWGGGSAPCSGVLRDQGLAPF